MAALNTNEIPMKGVPVLKNKESLEPYYGTSDLQKIDVKRKSNEGRKAVLESVKKKNPKVESIDKAAEQIDLNTEQLQKKESFLKKTLLFPVRHPFITAAGVGAGIYGLHALGVLSFTVPAAVSGWLANYVDLPKLQQVISSMFSVGKAVGPTTGVPYAPGVGV